jgi:hypothetical protein
LCQAVGGGAFFPDHGLVNVILFHYQTFITMRKQTVLSFFFLLMAMGSIVAQQLGINTAQPKGDVHIYESGITSNLTNNLKDFGTSLVISGADQAPRIYLEHTTAELAPPLLIANKALVMEYKDGSLRVSGLNDSGTEFSHPNAITLAMGQLDLLGTYFNYSYLGLGLANPSHPLHLSSGAYCDSDGEWTNASDRRLKEGIEPISYGLQDVLDLEPVQYRMKTTGNSQVGFIAQDVRELIPELISGTEGDVSKGETLGMSYGNLTAVLVKAIQEQQEMIEALQSQNKILQQGLAQLQETVLGTAHASTK